MFTRLSLMIASALCATAVLAPVAGAQPRATVGDLFVVNAHDATLTRQGTGDDYTLTMRSPERTVTAFADRPARTASAQSLRSFVAGWAQLGFAADAPNAALVVNGRSTVFTISHPRIAKNGALILRAHKISEQAGAASARRAAPRKLGRASLFIDPSESAVPLTITVSGIPASSEVRVSFPTAMIDPFGSGNMLQSRTFAPSAFTVAGDAVIFVAGEQGLQGMLSTAIDAAGRTTLTGNALLPPGATMTIQAGTGAPTQVGAGDFSVPLS